VDRVLVALDVSTAPEALALADALRGAVAGFKIGSQLFTAAGPDIVRTLVARGDKIFLDLKFHDIPNTVAGAVASAARLGVWMLTVHASGGAAMLEAARESAERSTAPGRPRPILVAVTVLTSLDAATLEAVGVTASPLDQAVRLAGIVQAAGLDGVVASPQETAAIRRACGPAFMIVTPGIRGGSAALETAGSPLTPQAPQRPRQQEPQKKDDQQRTSTPAGAVAAGATYLVVGRPITAAGKPREAAMRIAGELAAK
jgi:orotidine-5'-phosphate decarboxylase